MTLTVHHKDRPLRVVTVAASLARNTGGPAITLVQGTRSMGDSVERTIFTTDAAQPAGSRPFRRVTPEMLPNGASEISIRIFRTRRPHHLIFSPGLWHALQTAVPGADLVTIHSLNLFPQYAAFAAARRAGVPYIVMPHGALDPWLSRNRPLVKRLVNRIWQQRMLRNAAAIHFTTQEEADLAGAAAASAPHLIIPNGLELDRFLLSSSDGTTFRHQRLNDHSGPIVLFFGRVAAKKGIDLLIQAFARIRPDGTLLVVAGPDDEGIRRSLEKLSQDLGVGDRVVFVGPMYGQDQIDALRAADVWALTSHTENFGNAVVEAMAAGCPVLISTEVNLAPQVAAAEAGVVTTLAIEDIAAKLVSLLADEGRRAQLSSSARQFAQRFDWSVVAPDLVRAFRDVSHRDRVPSPSHSRSQDPSPGSLASP